MRWANVEVAMKSRNLIETDEERDARLALETRDKRDRVAAEDAAIDRLIRRNIEQFGA